MSAPSLYKISGRVPPIKQSGLSTPRIHHSSASPMKPNPPRDAVDIRTESIHSAEPLPSSSGDFTPAFRLKLEELFPSMQKVLEFMKQRQAEPQAFCAVSQHFLTTYRTCISEIGKFPGTEMSDNEIQLRVENIEAIISLFEKDINDIASSKRSSRTPDSVLDLAILAIELLDRLFSLIREKKALPPLPNIDAKVVQEDYFSVDQSSPATESAVSCSSGTKVNSEPSNPPTSIEVEGTLLDEEADEITNLPDSGGLVPSKSFKGRLVRNIKKKVTHTTGSIFHHKSKPSSVFVESKGNSEIDKPYLPRLSAIYFPADPLVPDVDLDLPGITDDLNSFAYDKAGQIKAGTLKSFIRLLTSHDGFERKDLIVTILDYFREFSSPTLLFNELAQRYDEFCPSKLDPAQTQAWDHNTQMKRIRVARILTLWLKTRWNANSDSVILPAIKAFIEERVKDVLPIQETTAIIEGLRIAESDIPTGIDESPAKPCRRPSTGRKSSPKKLKFAKKPSHSAGLQLLAFNSGSGRLEVARQLTTKISDMFRRVKPEEMVKYWSLSQNEKAAIEQKEEKALVIKCILTIRDFEQALSMWVSYTILKQYERSQRVDLISFWLDIAIHLLDLRNFSSACCVYTGVAHASVGNMKATIISVSQHAKAQFHKLELYFSGFGNYGECRTAMSTGLEPTVPLTAPLKHDIGVMREIPKTIQVKASDDSEELVDLINLNGYRIMNDTIKSLKCSRLPYDIPKDDVFQMWLDEQLHRFCNHEKLEELYETLYDRGRKREPRDQRFATIQNPWLFVMEGNNLDKLTRINPEMLATSLATTKAKSILQSFRTRGTKKA